MTPEAQLTVRQLRAIGAVLTTATREEAAKEAGIAPRTLRRWSALDTFAAELRRQRTRQLDTVATVLVAGACRCVQTLIEIATSGGSPRDAVRASAARAVIDLAHKFEEAGTLAVRLGELEGWAAKIRAGQTGAPWQ